MSIKRSTSVVKRTPSHQLGRAAAPRADDDHYPPPAKALAMSLQAAIDSLQNNKVLRSTEAKGAVTIDVSYPPELVKGLRAMFPAGRKYEFLLHFNSTLASIGGGVFTGYLAWNATSSYGEWTALAALFDECKLEQAHLTWTTAFGAASTGIIVQVSLAPDFVTNGVTPTFTPVTRLAESAEFGVEVPGPKGAATMTRVATVPKLRQWALTASPTSSSLDCGMNGQWSYASNIVTTATINVAFVVMRNTARFRNRA